MSEPIQDTRFSLPSVDDPASTEVGVILLGLDADRLLAGLGLSGLSDDPAVVTLLVDEARHDRPGAALVPGPSPGSSLADAVLAGALRWRSARKDLAAAGPMSVSAAPRQAWAQMFRALSTDVPAEPAAHAYLTACWLRRDDVDRRAAAVLDGTSRT